MTAMPRPLRILIHGINYAPGATGIPKYNAEFGAWFAARGHRVEALAAFPHYPRWRVDEAYRGRGRHVETIDGVRVHRVPVHLPDSGTVRARERIGLELQYSWRGLRFWIPRVLSRERFDVVFAVCPPLQAAVAPWIYGLLRDVPWVFHVQDLQVDAALALGMLSDRPNVRRALLGIERFLLQRASLVTTISGPMRRRLLERGLDPARVLELPNWADLDRVAPGPSENPFRRELGIPPTAVLAMAAGTMGEKHGLEAVLAAADRLRDRPDLAFAFVGDGSARARLESEARRLRLANVVFAPLQPVERLSEVLAAGDIHLILQRRGAADLVMPSKLTNIAAAGRPCVATADPGTALADAVSGHGLGVLARPEDPDALTDAIARLAADPAARARLGENARRFAETELSRGRILGRFEVVLVDGLVRRGLAGEPEAPLS